MQLLSIGYPQMEEKLAEVHFYNSDFASDFI